jgi:hypothetical protein
MVVYRWCRQLLGFLFWVVEFVLKWTILALELIIFLTVWIRHELVDKMMGQADCLHL